MRHKTVLLLVFGLALVALAIGCGDDDFGPGDAEDIDVCQLLTHDDVAEVMEAEIQPGGRQDLPPMFRCFYPVEAFLGVIAEVYADDRAALEEYMDREVAGGEDAEEIEGIGERAVWYGGNVALEVLQDGYVISIGITAVGTEDARGKSIEMASRMLERLP